METQELATTANQLACEIRRLALHSHEPRHREALRRAEALALGLAQELEQAALQWPEAAREADVASRRSY